MHHMRGPHVHSAGFTESAAGWPPSASERKPADRGTDCLGTPSPSHAPRQGLAGEAGAGEPQSQLEWRGGTLPEELRAPRSPKVRRAGDVSFPAQPLRLDKRK